MKKRKKEGGIVISETDKSGRLTVSTPENYEEQGRQHVEKDIPIGWKEVEEIKKEVAGHNRCVKNIFRMGKDWGEKEEERVGRTMMEGNTVIPGMYMNQKDHKPLPENGIPKTRPVCSA